MIHILLSLRRPSFRGGAVSCSVFFSLFAGDSLWQVVFFFLGFVCVCVCQGDLSMFSTMGCSTIALPVGEVFFANRSSQVEIVFFVILWPGDFGTFMRDAKRPESLPRNITVGFREACFWMNCSLLRATPHKYVWHFIVEEHFNWCFCCWWAKFNTGWLSSKFRWWNDHLVAVEHYSSTLSGPTGI